MISTHIEHIKCGKQNVKCAHCTHKNKASYFVLVLKMNKSFTGFEQHEVGNRIFLLRSTIPVKLIHKVMV